MTDTFVYDGAEVRKTGREAVKEIKTLPGKPQRQTTLIEITPVDEQDGWKKWVDPAHLYAVRNPVRPIPPPGKILRECDVQEKPK